MMKRYAITAIVAAVLGACIALAIVMPRNTSETAKLKSAADEYRTALDTSRQELDAARSALDRAESANRELAGRIADLGKSLESSAVIAGQIRSGIDGDLDETRIAHDAIRKALGTIRRIQDAIGEADQRSIP